LQLSGLSLKIFNNVDILAHSRIIGVLVVCGIFLSQNTELAIKHSAKLQASFPQSTILTSVE